MNCPIIPLLAFLWLLNVVPLDSEAAFPIAQNLKCNGKRMMTLQRPQNSPHPSAELIIDEAAQEIIYNYNGNESLIYQLPTNRYFWKTTPGFRNSVELNGSKPYFINTASVGARKPQKHYLPLPAEAVVNDLRKHGAQQIQAQFDSCVQYQSLDDQYRGLIKKPLTNLEIESCRENIAKITKFYSCSQSDRCAEDVESALTPPDPERSFVRLFESGVAISDPMKRSAAVLGVNSALSMPTTALMVAQHKAIGMAAAKIGMSFASVFSLYYALSWASIPLFFAFYDVDDCGENGFQVATARNATDCIGKNGVQLNTIFAGELIKAIAEPERFLSDAKAQTDGTMPHLACYAIESNLASLRANLKSYGTPICEGRTLRFANGTSYLIADDSHLYRHQNAERTLHFYHSSIAQIENRGTGFRKPAITTMDFAEQVAADRRNQGRLDSNLDAIVTQEVLQENILLQGLAPQFHNLIRGGKCSASGTAESNSSTAN